MMSLKCNNSDHISNLILNGKSLEFVKEWKYLGVTIVSGERISFSARPALSSFYCAFNSIFSVLHKPDEIVLMNLLFTNCVPILAYGAEAVEFSNSDMQTFNTAINDAIRRIFSYQRWESTRFLRPTAGFPSIYEIFSRRSEVFLFGNLTSHNEAITHATVIFLLEQIEND